MRFPPGGGNRKKQNRARPQRARQAQIACKRKGLKTLSVVALFFESLSLCGWWVVVVGPGERDAYMGAEGCSASARAFQGVRFHWPHTIRVYFVLSPKFLGTCYWCAIKIFVLFFAISAGRRKSQKTKPGSAPTGSASANCVHAQNVENTKRFGIFF